MKITKISLVLLCLTFNLVSTTPVGRKKVLILGAGAAGMALPLRHFMIKELPTFLYWRGKIT